MKDVRKIHFINRIDRENAGDWNCCPLEYYYWYFKDYNIMRHDIGDVVFNEIDRDDVVILGGGGLFNVLSSFNQTINRILMLCDNVVAWSCGFNAHNEEFEEETEPIDFKRFKLITIRDYDHPSGFEYLPCPSVKALRFDKDRRPIRKYGVMYHRNLPEISKLPFDSISNNESISRINEFIMDSEAIVTNSYHCAYWASLLERKAIVVNKFSSKFDHFKYVPKIVNISPDNTETAVELIDKAFETASVYDGCLEEAERLNDSFLERVRKMIDDLGFWRSNDYQNFYQLSMASDLRIENLQGEISMLNDNVTWLYDKLDKIIQLEQANMVKQQSLEKQLSDLHSYITDRQ